jgi:Mn-dependent DtxR family transcriptional regulator
MTHEDLILQTLDALYVLHGEAVSIVDASTLARHLGTSATRVAETLLHLESRGLVDASTARLTMAGLATAAALSAARVTAHVAA